MPSTRTTKSLIRNAIEACQSAGFDVGAIEVAAGGVVRILPKSSISAQPAPTGGNSCDALFKGESD
jgi:hypothetical protein